MLYAVTALVLGLSVFSSSSLQLPGFAGKEGYTPVGAPDHNYYAGV